MSCRGRKNGVLGKTERFELCLAFPHFFLATIISIKGKFFETKYCLFHVLTSIVYLLFL
jgi:hypothetical protein